MRVTNRIMTKNFLNNLYRNIENMDELQNQLSSSKKFQVPSDDPIGAVTSMGLNSNITELKQYQRNISKGVSYLETSDTSVKQLNELLKRARDLTVEGANGTLAQNERDAIAGEFDQILESIYNIANTTVEGKALFGGFETLDKPFRKLESQPRDLYDENDEKLPNLADGRMTQIIYAGDSGKIKKQVEKDINLQVNTPGNELFSQVRHEAIIAGRNNVSSPEAQLNPDFNSQSFVIWVGDKSTKVDLDSPKGSTIRGVADAINVSRAGVTASIVQDDETGASALKITSDKPGYENAFVLSSIDDDPNAAIKDLTSGLTNPYILDDYDVAANTGGMGLSQKVESLNISTIALTGSFTDRLKTPLNKLDFDGDPSDIGEFKSGNVVLNGYSFYIEKGTDTLETVVDKINEAPIDVRASFSDNTIVFESPGSLEIIDDESNFFETMGIIDPTGAHPNRRLYQEQGEKDKANGIFEIMMDVRNDLLKGDTESLSKKRIDELDDAITHVLNTQTKIGSRLNRFEQINDRMDDVNINLQELLSMNEDVDIAKTITELQLVENIHQATLSVGGKIIPPTLMNYI